MAVRYLVPEGKHLPVSGEDGKPDHRLMAAAHAALFSNYRGQPYAGPDKEGAKTRLRALYKSEGMDWPGGGTGNREQAGEIANQKSQIANDTGPRFMVLLGEAAKDGLIRIPIAVTGQWKGAEKEFSVGLDDLEEIRRNFAAKPTGEINVDYEHDSEVPYGTGGPVLSAGRIVKLDAPENFNGSGKQILWGWFDPTARARELIAAREYRYISPAIRWGAKDKVTGKPVGTVLTSVALVNKPFLEEMPQLHLSEEAGSQKVFVSLGQVHVPAPVNSEGRNGGPQISVGFDQPGGKTMGKLQLKCAADGTHEVHGPDGKIGEIDGDHLKEYVGQHVTGCDRTASEAAVLVEIGMAGKSLLEAAAMVKRGIEAPVDRFAALSEAIADGKLNTAKCGELADAGKVRFSDVLAAQEAERKVEAAIKAGKVLPKNRGAAFKLALSDAAGFTALLEEAKPVVDLRAHGHAGAGETPTAQQSLMAEVNAYAKENKCSLSVALSEITKAKPELWRQYSEEVVMAVEASQEEEE